MILRNFKVLNLLKQIGSHTDSIEINTSPLVCKDLNGNSIDKFYVGIIRYNGYQAPLDYKGVTTYLRFGSGNTPVTENDYKLDNEITSGIENSADRKFYCTVKSDSIAVDYVYHLKNTSNDTLTIREIGLSSFCNTENAGNPNYFLVTREVLEEPIVVPAGGYFTIQTGLKFSI